MSTQKRQAAARKGQRGETLAAWALRLKGYRIIARGHRNPMGEIDIIAQRGKVLAFVEVKARTSIDAAMNAIGTHQQHRIERAAAGFIGTRPEYLEMDIRFDVIAALPMRWPIHVPDAWRPSPQK